MLPRPPQHGHGGADGGNAIAGADGGNAIARASLRSVQGFGNGFFFSSSSSSVSSSSSSSFVRGNGSANLKLSLVRLRRKPRCHLFLRAVADGNGAPAIGGKEAEYKRLMFQKLRKSEIERIRNLEEMKRKADIQSELEVVQATEWSKLMYKLFGKAKGSYWDPIPSHTIPFSEFWRLLQAKKVQYLEYDDLGNNVAVTLQYYEDVVDSIPKSQNVEGNPDKPDKIIICKRHLVANMPPDAWTEIWRSLHQQLIHVQISNPNFLLANAYLTLDVVILWAMRLTAAVFIYQWIDNSLFPIYRLRDPDDRPKIGRPKLNDYDFAGLGSFGQSRARFISAEESTGVTFDDFAGQEYVKRELQEVVKILKDTGEFESLGIYCPKGVLLYGPPGTGKTLLARAIAGEAGLPFFSASGSEFVEMFVGVAAARVKDLFARARQFSPSIIFIDEIDAIGAKRGGSDFGGGGAEREQGLIQILTEMDGFQSIEAKVLVVGATNRVDMLDPALLRKGRFDKIIHVGLPTEEGRVEVLKVHARNKSFRSEVEKLKMLQEVADLAVDFSGAELENILNEASILCARKDKDYIERDEMLEALRRQEGYFDTGEEDPIDATGEAAIRIAYREAAIAVLECYFPNKHRPFLKTTIRYADQVPNMEYAKPKGVVFSRRSDIVDHIIRVCAPRVVEELIFGKDQVSWGSGTSIVESGTIAQYLILQTGFTALGKVHYHSRQDVVAHLLPKIQALRDEYVRYGVEKCRAVLKEYRSALETIAAVLLEKFDIEAPEIWEAFENAPRIPQPEPAPVDEYGALLYSGRWGIHGVSLPGRVTFSPGNLGFATFGAPRPQQLQTVRDEAWQMLDALRKSNMEKQLKRRDATKEIPDILLSEHYI